MVRCVTGWKRPTAQWRNSARALLVLLMVVGLGQSIATRVTAQDDGIDLDSTADARIIAQAEQANQEASDQDSEALRALAAANEQLCDPPPQPKPDAVTRAEELEAEYAGRRAELAPVVNGAWADMLIARGVYEEALAATQGVPDNQKSDEYKRLEAEIAEAESTMDDIDRRVQQATDVGEVIRDESLFTEYQEARGRAEEARRDLRDLPESRQHQEDLTKLQDAAKAAEDAYYRSVLAYVVALSDYSAVVRLLAGARMELADAILEWAKGCGGDSDSDQGQVGEDPTLAAGGETPAPPPSNCEDPGDSDTDGDGVSDADECERGTSLMNADTDGDLVDDGLESTYGTDPLTPDTDGDGLIDGDEIAGEPPGAQYGTDPLTPDTDNDGQSDGVEIEAGSNPLDPESIPE